MRDHRSPARTTRARVRSATRLALVVSVAVAASGCATYADRLNQANRSASAGNYAGAVADVNAVLGVASTDELPNQWTGDRPLAALERGSLQQALGSYPGSTRDLSGAEPALELLDMKTDPVGELGSYLYSDSVKTYRTPPSERLSLNPINLLNYLAVGDLDGAAVEARRFQVMRDYLASRDITGRGTGDARNLSRRLRLRAARRGRPRLALLRGSAGGRPPRIARRPDRPTGALQSVPRTAPGRSAGAAEEREERRTLRRRSCSSC